VSELGLLANCTAHSTRRYSPATRRSPCRSSRPLVAPAPHSQGPARPPCARPGPGFGAARAPRPRPGPRPPRSPPPCASQGAGRCTRRCSPSRRASRGPPSPTPAGRRGPRRRSAAAPPGDRGILLGRPAPLRHRHPRALRHRRLTAAAAIVRQDGIRIAQPGPQALLRSRPSTPRSPPWPKSDPCPRVLARPCGPGRRRLLHVQEEAQDDVPDFPHKGLFSPGHLRLRVEQALHLAHGAPTEPMVLPLGLRGGPVNAHRVQEPVLRRRHGADLLRPDVLPLLAGDPDRTRSPPRAP